MNNKNKSFIDKKYSHLTYKDRCVINEFLNYGHSFTAIGNRIHKDRTTVSKEIRIHRYLKPFKKNRETDCNKLLKAPYVCNGCECLGKCHKAKYIYDAAVADHEYKSTLSLQRSHLMLLLYQDLIWNEKHIV